MFAFLQGTISRAHHPGTLVVEVNGVGYKVECPLNVWESIAEDIEQKLYTSTYIREDRFDIFGFKTEADKELFELFIAQSGIGPKLGLELMSVPPGLFKQAVDDNDASALKSIKGIGGKTAEKLLLELKGIAAKDPNRFGKSNTTHTTIDQDALAALEGLGYDTKTATAMLQNIATDLESTEQRVEAALKQL